MSAEMAILLSFKSTVIFFKEGTNDRNA
jgi:hypothetical protein